MQADFLDAHQRHWQDAEALFGQSRWANADQLYGMTAECGLKRLMQAFGMTVDPPTGKPKDRLDQKHIDTIWTRYESYRGGHHQGTGYILPAPNPFDDWDISDRYAHQSNFDLVRVQSHRTGADCFASVGSGFQSFVP
ncbi:MAG: SAM-dependent methyltransferase [Candidatus Competibacteraceae bacterium]|nr:SAM-dependent methyltransferase [Candidatus Competibacteraceae bacterium]